MKKIIILLLSFPMISNAQLGDLIKQTADKYLPPAKTTDTNTNTTNSNTTTTTNTTKPTSTSSNNNIFGKVDIASGLKEALNNGISKQVSKLTAVDGFFKNEAVKILLPEELQKVDKTLRSIGLSSLADQGLLVLNRAAESAVKESTPIFVNAVKNMKFSDAKSILLGSENSATTYLQSTTSSQLTQKFTPVVKSSLAKAGADKVWETIIKKYNSIPLVTKVNPDLTSYTTQKALEGVFKMITVEEKNIRTNLNSRTSNLLKNVFALQDKK